MYIAFHVILAMYNWDNPDVIEVTNRKASVATL